MFLKLIKKKRLSVVLQVALFIRKNFLIFLLEIVFAQIVPSSFPTQKFPHIYEERRIVKSVFFTRLFKQSLNDMKDLGKVIPVNGKDTLLADLESPQNRYIVFAARHGVRKSVSRSKFIFLFNKK